MALLRWLSGAVLQCCCGAAVGAVSPVTGFEVRSVAVCSRGRQLLALQFRFVISESCA